MLRRLLRYCSSMPFYAVLEGKQQGIYLSWAECLEQVSGYSNAKFKKFDTREEAERFLQGNPKEDVKHLSVKNVITAPVFKAKSLTQKHVLGQYKKCAKKTQLIDAISDANLSSVVSHRFSSAPVVYTDGACLGNGTSNAVAGIGVYWAPLHPKNVSEKLVGDNATNQKAELSAAIRALEDAISMDLDRVELRTDSVYTIKAMTEWIRHWKVGDKWTNAQGEPVCNMAAMKRLDELCSQIKVTWVHVPGHQGVYGNEQADQFARQGALKK